MENPAIRTVNFENFRLNSPVKPGALPKRRHDTNSVYSFGLKYSLKVEKSILKNFPNSDYFNVDYKKLKIKLVEDKDFRDTYVKRILLNRNIKKNFASLEKPFPLIKKISSNQALNKTEDFIASISKSPMTKNIKDNLERLIKLRMNKEFNFSGAEKQRNSLYDKLNGLNKNITSTNKEQENALEVNFNKRKNVSKDNDNNSLDNSNIFAKNSVNNSLNKNDFFLISSNFGSKNRSKNKHPTIIMSPEQKLIEKEKEEANRLEKEIISSLEYKRQKTKYEENFSNDPLNFHVFQVEKNLRGLKFKQNSQLNPDSIFNQSCFSSLKSNFITNFNFHKCIKNINEKRSEEVESLKEKDITETNAIRVEENSKDFEEKEESNQYNKSDRYGLNSSISKIIDKKQKKIIFETQEKFSIDSINDSKNPVKTKVGSLYYHTNNNINNNFSIDSDLHKSIENINQNSNVNSSNFKQNEKNFLYSSNGKKKEYKKNSNRESLANFYSKNSLNSQISNVLNDCIEVSSNNVLKEISNYNDDLNLIRIKSKPFKPNFEKYKYEGKNNKDKDNLLHNLKEYWKKKNRSKKIQTKLENNLNYDVGNFNVFLSNDNNI